MKKVLFTRKNHSSHWVGDGFPVRSVFTYNDIAKDISPFLLMDYAGPARFDPAKPGHTRGVGEHPHRGFETVTIVYDGEVVHRDSAGGGGNIGPGDVQWMTAASGVVHEEKHGPEFSRKGGIFEMVQLWVNLPARHKMDAPRYQGILSASIPKVEWEGGSLRVIAGNFRGQQGPAKTFSPVQLWDLRLQAGAKAELSMPQGQSCVVFVLAGKLRLDDGETLGNAELAALGGESDAFTLHAEADTKLLVLGGEPLNEPIVGYGPFVMNSVPEIRQAFVDFEQGKMGQLVKIASEE